MPSPLIRSPVSGPSRRTAMAVFVVAAGALVTGCTEDGRPGRASGGRRNVDRVSEADPDVALAALAVWGERFAVDAATATMDRHADLAAEISGVLDAHVAHVRLLAAAAPDEAAGASPAPPAAAPTPDEPLDPFEVPARPLAALRRLASMERDLSLANRRHAFAAESGAFARILASMAASAAQHAVVLDLAATDPAGR